MAKGRNGRGRDFDVVIVGGGPGGLAIGSMLAQAGISSAIIERLPALGGRYRSVNFHGASVDCAVHLLVSLGGSVESTYTYRLMRHLGLPLEYKVLPWAMGKVTRDKPGTVEFLAMDPKLGAANFFAFFAFAAGVEPEESTKKALLRMAEICAGMSEEDCRRAVDVPFSDWIERNVDDPVAKLVLHNMGPVIGAPVTDVNFGMVANSWRTFSTAGAPLIWYPKHQNIEAAVIAPLADYYVRHGGTVITNRTVKRIVVEQGEARGVVIADDANCSLLEEYRAGAVICAIPIFEAVSRNILGRECLTPDWAEAVERFQRLAIYDLSGFYLLRRDVMPRDGAGWVNIYDLDYGVPTYVGDVCSAAFTNSANEPPGKQILCSLIPGSGGEETNFGIPTRWDRVNEAHARWKDAVEKAFPGFKDAIEDETFNLQLNFSRYAYAVVPREVDIASPNIGGLYFGGDSIRSIGTPMSDKCFQLAFPLCERITEHLRS